MSDNSTEDLRTDEDRNQAERREIAELQDRLDAEADGEGLAAEAGRSEEMGLAEG